MFAQTRFTLNDFIDQNTATFVNLFVKDPADQDDASYITPPIKTIYTIDDLYDQIEYTRIGVSLTSCSLAIGHWWVWSHLAIGGCGLIRPLVGVVDMDDRKHSAWVYGYECVHRI